MATKADLTEVEWQTLQWAVADTMAYLSMADPGFWEMFKEASGAAKYVAGVKALQRERARPRACGRLQDEARQGGDRQSRRGVGGSDRPGD